jgi:hypothetical protein
MTVWPQPGAGAAITGAPYPTGPPYPPPHPPLHPCPLPKQEKHEKQPPSLLPNPQKPHLPPNPPWQPLQPV